MQYLKKTVLTLTFLTILTTFYGLNARFDAPEMEATAVEADAAADLAGGSSAAAAERCLISDFDPLMRRVSDEEGNDWRLMSAIAYHESRFKPDIVSRRGARGLMQIMPSVARQFDVPQERVLDPETNVRLANRLLNQIASMLRLPADVPFHDRMSIILASYNGGIGHVSDARRLARAHGDDPNRWEVVARYLQLKAEPEYYLSDVVRCGRFTGYRQTKAYVADVMQRYETYCRLARR